jgi:hypothetical protein
MNTKYQATQRTHELIERNFTFIPKARPDQTERYKLLREKGKELATFFAFVAPESRELSLALTNLEQALMWAANAIARNEQGQEE